MRPALAIVLSLWIGVGCCGVLPRFGLLSEDSHGCCPQSQESSTIASACPFTQVPKVPPRVLQRNREPGCVWRI